MSTNIRWAVAIRDRATNKTVGWLSGRAPGGKTRSGRKRRRVWRLYEGAYGSHYCYKFESLMEAKSAINVKIVQDFLDPKSEIRRHRLQKRSFFAVVVELELSTKLFDEPRKISDVIYDGIDPLTQLALSGCE